LECWERYVEENGVIVDAVSIFDADLQAVVCDESVR
jgi:hypothetical protein